RVLLVALWGALRGGRRCVPATVHGSHRSTVVPRQSEAVVQQLPGLCGQRIRTLFAAQQHHSDPSAVTLGTTRVGVLRVVRESRLATEESGVAAEQLVVVAEWVVLLAVLSGEGELLRADDPGDPLAPHSCVVDDAEVVGGTHHA